MIDTSIRELLNADESATIEHGTAAWADHVEKVGQVVCAFANGQGGTLTIGGKDENVANAEEKACRLREVLQKRLSPNIAATVRSEPMGEQAILLVEVPAGYDLPYTFDREIFVRSSRQTQRADGVEARALIAKRAAFGPRWERQIAVGVGLDDLDTQRILRVAREAEGGRFFVFEDRTDVWSVLRDLDLAEGELLRNSAYALFGRRPDKRFPQMRLRAVAYSGTEQEKFSDSRMLGGNLYEILEKGLEFLKDHTPIVSEIPREGLRRAQKASYPMPAIREALLNAIVHRDYAPVDGSASIAVYADRIEVWNVGDLPKDMDIPDLKQIHASRPRNPDIAHLFLLHGQIELLGSGTRRIVREFRTAGLPEPEWRRMSGGIMLVLPREKRSGSSASVEDLNQRQRAILKDLAAGDAIRIADYIARSPEPIKERQARDDLKGLVGMGFLRRRGKARQTEYVRTEKQV